MTKPITGAKIQQIVADLANQLPDANCTQPFGPEYDVFKVKEKVFAMTTEVRGEKIVTLKCVCGSSGHRRRATFVRSGRRSAVRQRADGRGAPLQVRPGGPTSSRP